MKSVNKKMKKKKLHTSTGSKPKINIFSNNAYNFFVIISFRTIRKGENFHSWGDWSRLYCPERRAESLQSVFV